ncbi:MAG: GNAT family N-acetyltransferase [Fimbriimonadaceae bacterium]|nr:GNAT family N-acetyltransferase [Fimbriimonadaceae bacterium]
MLIRPYRPQDAAGVVNTIKTVFEEYGFGWYPESYCQDVYNIDRAYPAPDNWFWVVEDPTGEVVGCAGLALHERLPGEPGEAVEVDGDQRVAGSDCELVRLYVLPQARGHALGRRLTKTAMAQAHEAGRTHIELWSDKKLTHAHAMYEALGAVRVGDRICPGDPDQAREWGYVLPV